MQVPCQPFSATCTASRLTPIFVGVAIYKCSEDCVELAYRTHDGNQGLDYAKIDIDTNVETIYEHIATRTQEYARRHGTTL